MHEGRLRYHFKYNYLSYLRSTRRVTGIDHASSIRERIVHGDSRVTKFIKRFRALSIHRDDENWNPETDNGYQSLREKYKNKIAAADRKRLYGRIGFQDTLNSYGLMVKSNSKVLWAHDEYSIAHPEEYAMNFRIWTEPVKSRAIPYLGMIDDDLLYDFRLEEPLRRILTHNKNGVFIYVYDFDTYRKRSADWYHHDRLLYGYTDDFREDRRNPARIAYGPILTEPNHPVLRALRVYIFQRMYLAKLRLARLIHPAPKWLPGAGDYTQVPKSCRLADPSVERYRKEIEPQVNAAWNRDERSFIDQVLGASHEEYFYWLFHKVLTPESALKAFDRGDTDRARYWARVLRYQEIYRDLHIHKMYVRTARTLEQDMQRYWNDRFLSVALWSGSCGYGKNRHRFNPGLKTLFPYFDIANKPGHPGCINASPGGAHRSYHRAGFSNTGGLIYAGDMTRRELEAFNRDYQKRYNSKKVKFHQRIWQDAVAGPFMIVSRRTYKRYGHRYFEKLAGKHLKMVDVTGALVESTARILLTPDPDAIAQMMDMDYFYYKRNDRELYGRNKMKPSFKIRMTEATVPRRAVYDPVRLARNPVTEELHDIAREYHSDVYGLGKVSQYQNIIGEVKEALEQDEKEFSGLSLIRGNYYPVFSGEPMSFPRKGQSADRLYPLDYSGQLHKSRFYSEAVPLKEQPRTPRSIEFLSTIMKLRKSGSIEKLKSRYGKGLKFKQALMRKLRKTIPWMLYNPNLFLVYYTHIRDLMPILNAFTGYRGRELSNGIGDGTMVFSSASRLQPFAADASMLAIKDRCIWKHDSCLRMLWNYCNAFSRYSYDFRSDIIAYGKFRKMLWHFENNGSPFPLWESTLSNMTGSAYEFSYYHHTYRWIWNNVGNPIFLREPTSAFIQGKQNNQGRAYLMSRLFPNLLRYLNKSVLESDLSFYSEYAWRKKYAEFTYQPDIRTYIMFYPYEPRIMTQALLQYKSCCDQNISQEYHLKRMKLEMRARKSIFPTENHTFVISDGIQTTLLERKNGEAFSESNMKLYENLQSAAGEKRPEPDA